MFNHLRILVIINLCIVAISSQECRSYQRLTGNCVSIKSCPPLFFVLTNNPNAAQLRSLQRLTCGFESSDPKVCCPLSSITDRDHSSSDDSVKIQDLNTATKVTPSESPQSMSPSPSTDVKVPSSTLASILLPYSTASPIDIQDYSSHPGFKQIPTIKECGTGVGHNRIIGGKNVSHGAYPWMARLGYKSPIPGRIDYHCGGTVISKRFILTAAHCVEGVEDEYAPITIRLGEHNIETEEDCNQDIGQCSKVEDYKIQKIISHSDYNVNSKQNDITLIMVDRDINFDSLFIHPICLPFTNEYHFEFLQPNLEMGIVAGFGRTKWNNAEGSPILQEVTLPIKSNEDCQSVYNRRITISDGQLCAGGEHGKDSCGGDSGGPIMAPAPVNRVPKMFQLGVVSFGPTHCGVGGLPGVYSRTSFYLKWILDKMNEESPMSPL